MAYTTQVNFIPLGGGLPMPSVTARLWRLWHEHADDNNPSREQQQDMQDVTFTASVNPTSISFTRDTDISDIGHQFGLSIQGATATPDTDWYFRSGKLDLLPHLQIEVLYDDRPTKIADTEIIGLLPSPPFTIDGAIKITTLTGSINRGHGGIDFSAGGTRQEVAQKVRFSYTGTFILSPTAVIADAGIKAISVGISGDRLQYSGLIAGNTQKKLESFFLNTICPQLGTNIENRVRAAILATANTPFPGRIMTGATTLSVRRIDIATSEILVKAALSAFGGVFLPRPKAIVGLGGKCIDIKGAVNNNGTPIILYSRHGGLNQQWILTPDRFLVSPLDLNKCLGVKGLTPNNGTPIILWDKDGGPNQKWTHNSDGTFTCDLHPNRCIDVKGNIDKDGTELILWDKHGGANQKWRFV